MEYATLADTLGCPVCEEISTSPIFQCRNGHIICKDCLPRLKWSERGCHCPICRSPLPLKDIRSRPVEQLAATVDVKCKNASNGCQTITKATKISQHLASCEFIEDTWCRKIGIYQDCREKYFLKDFPSHCRLDHATNYQQLNSSRGLRTLIQFWSGAGPTTTANESWEPMFFELPNGNIYIVSPSLNKNKNLFTLKIFLRRGDARKTPDAMEVPITVTSSHCKVTWTLNPSNFDISDVERELPQPAEKDFLLLKIFSVSLETLFPSNCTRRQDMRCNVTFEFPKLPWINLPLNTCIMLVFACFYIFVGLLYA